MVHATVSYLAFGMAVMLATAAASAAMIVIGAKTGSPLMTVTGALVLALSIGSIFLPT